LADASLVRGLYDNELVEERHRHRYEVNNTYRSKLEGAGMRFSGLSPDGNLVEFIELDQGAHPYYVATQAHPELRSRPTRPHPLFVGLVDAAVERQRELRLPVEPLDGRSPREIIEVTR
jgi:CTP synthase